MNGKRAKQIRLDAEIEMCVYAHNYVLNDDLIKEAYEKGYTPVTLYKILPKSSLIMSGRTRQQGLGTQKWFYKWAKKCYNNSTPIENWKKYYDFK